MMDYDCVRRWCAVSSILGVVVAPLQSVAQMQEFSLNMGAVYYECVDPDEKPPCVCGTDEKKAETCPTCLAWAQRTLGLRWTVRFDAQQYSFATHPFVPRANFLARDVAKQVYNVDYPETAFGYPITAETMFASYDDFGWIELDEEIGSRIGALAVTSSWMGLVVSEDESVNVLYPSSRRNGDLAISNVNYVVPGEEVKYLLPKELFMRAAEL